MVSLYLPITQATHSDPSSVYPRLQVQFEAEFEPAPAEVEPIGQRVQLSELISPDSPEYVPASHSKQVLEPVMFLYEPATHAEHAWPSGPVYPLLHEQFFI